MQISIHRYRGKAELAHSMLSLKLRRVWLAAIVGAAFLGVMPVGAQTDDYPSKMIRLVVAYAPGGATDIQARLLGEKLSQALGRQVLIDNRPGASGMLGAQIVVRANPDGYTLLLAGANEAALNVPLFKNMAYDPRTDLAPVTLLSVAPVILVSSPQSNLKTLQDVLAASRGGAALNFGSVGIGSPNHIAGELLNSAANIKLNHVPYQGAGPAMTAVVGGHVPLAFLSLASAVPQIKSGNLRPIAVTTTNRFPTQPDIPTITEQGLAGFNISQWYGLLAPAKTPAAIVNRLHAEFTKLLKDPQIRNRILELGADPVGSTPTEFSAFIGSEIDKYRTLAARAGIEPQ